ncbi:MAG TPA: glycosyltransferase [Prolixibacteraceae bacterium]|nr:glycosyltransferase [Prolixibacteraceae bacterium]
MFANRYFKKSKKLPLIHEPPGSSFGICVVIPCFREPDILKTLESLKACQLPVQNTEIIVVVNHSEIEGEKVKQFNLKTKSELAIWVADNSTEKLKFFIVGPLELQKKWAGAGLARKSGMDEAVYRFNQVGNPNGIIVSLDADTLVQPNYLVAIEKHFKHNPKNVGATILFRHQTDGLDKKHLEGIILYEKYQVYYKEAMGFTGYPYPMFTVGSAFAVKADAYIKRGGMNRSQAGEDFYFLQNLAQFGTVGEINETTVFPSARLSDRVPFGTGPVMQKWMRGEGQLSETYNFKAFKELKLFFDRKEEFYEISESEYREQLKQLPDSVHHFLKTNNFWKELQDLNQNCSNIETFKKRFFQKFNAFKILKYLNFAHAHFFDKADLDEQVKLLKKSRPN